MDKTQSQMLAHAIAIAAKAHVEQLDKGGNAYILHPIRIMMRLRTDDQELMQIAILHDVIEDSEEWTIEKLKELGFSKRVTTALQCLTHMKGDSYEAYIKIIGANRDATSVKIEDLRDNSDITRLKGISVKDFERSQKYHKSYVYLTEILKLNSRTFES